MVISQPAVVCLHVTVAQTTARATATSSKLLRLWPRPARTPLARQALVPHTSLPDLPDIPLQTTALRTGSADA